MQECQSGRSGRTEYVNNIAAGIAVDMLHRAPHQVEECRGRRREGAAHRLRRTCHPPSHRSARFQLAFFLKILDETSFIVLWEVLFVALLAPCQLRGTLMSLYIYQDRAFWLFQVINIIGELLNRVVVVFHISLKSVLASLRPSHFFLQFLYHNHATASVHPTPSCMLLMHAMMSDHDSDGGYYNMIMVQKILKVTGKAP
jgi:hypothetical protein